VELEHNLCRSEVVNLTAVLTAKYCFLNSFSAVKLLLTGKNLWNLRVDFSVKMCTNSPACSCHLKISPGPLN
jgi:hypothetical protein